LKITNYNPERKLFLLFSHKLTDEQTQDAKRSLNATDFIYLPDDLQKKWSAVDPEIGSLKEYSAPIAEWLKNNAQKDDYVLIQGDFGMVYYFVDIAFNNGFIPIYSTTERVFDQTKLDDGSIEMKKIIKHKIFRKYERRNKE